MTISQNIQHIKEQLPKHVNLVAVSKTQSIESIQDAYDAGQRIFGENKIQEMTNKWEVLPKDIQWHMIGHTQSNKVKYMAPYVELIHSVDSLKLLKEINKQAKKNKRTINCLLQIHIAEETTKFGLNQKELVDLINSDEFKSLKNIKIIGLMGMATFTDNKDQVKKEFHLLKNMFTEINSHQTENCHFEQISMGMSGDYPIAIDCGSTIVRIGSSIFGKRNT